MRRVPDQRRQKSEETTVRSMKCRTAGSLPGRTQDRWQTNLDVAGAHRCEQENQSDCFIQHLLAPVVSPGIVCVSMLLPLTLPPVLNLVTVGEPRVGKTELRPAGALPRSEKRSH